MADRASEPAEYLAQRNAMMTKFVTTMIQSLIALHDRLQNPDYDYTWDPLSLASASLTRANLSQLEATFQGELTLTGIVVMAQATSAQTAAEQAESVVEGAKRILDSHTHPPDEG